MARVIVKESQCLGKKFFNGTMGFQDVKDMVQKIGKVESVKVSKGTYSSNFTNNIHNIDIHKDGISFEIHLTENQFKKMLPTFKEMGEVEITEYYWKNRK